MDKDKNLDGYIEFYKIRATHYTQWLTTLLTLLVTLMIGIVSGIKPNLLGFLFPFVFMGYFILLFFSIENNINLERKIKERYDLK